MMKCVQFVPSFCPIGYGISIEKDLISHRGTLINLQEKGRDNQKTKMQLSSMQMIRIV